MKRYPHIQNGQTIEPRMAEDGGYRIACCSCGLVHRFDFRVVTRNGRRRVQFTVWLDARATGQIRRKLKRLGLVEIVEADGRETER